MNFLAFGRKNRARARSSTDGCTYGCAFSAARYRANSSTQARAAANDGCIALLRGLCNGDEWLGGNRQGFAVSYNLVKSELNARAALHTAGFFDVDHAAANLCAFLQDHLSVNDDRLGESGGKTIAWRALGGAAAHHERTSKTRCRRDAGLPVRFRPV